MGEKSLSQYQYAVDAIKTAILQGQYEASKGVNRIQLAVYFGIGKYISLNSRQGAWGTGAIETISQSLRKELPGLRGFSATNLKNMRLFYEAWHILDPKSSVMTDDLQQDDQQVLIKSSIATDDLGATSPIAILNDVDNSIDINQAIVISNIKDFPVDDFFKVPFTHHIEIFTKVSSLDARFYYIRRTVEEHLSVRALAKLISEDAYGKQDLMPSNFGQTFTDAEQARKALMMFKDSYLLNFINVEQIGERDALDVDERVVEQQIVQRG